MGCNFYLLDGRHIGKRSAAGFYCFDCSITLCKEGNKGVHLGRSEWDCICPKCGQFPKNESLENSSVGLELGFNRMSTEEKKGVRSCSSFTWALDPIHLQNRIIVKDEYGKRYKIHEFLKMLKTQCPIQFYDMIGQEFS